MTVWITKKLLKFTKFVVFLNGSCKIVQILIVGIVGNIFCCFQNKFFQKFNLFNIKHFSHRLSKIKIFNYLHDNKIFSVCQKTIGLLRHRFWKFYTQCKQSKSSILWQRNFYKVAWKNNLKIWNYSIKNFRIISYFFCYKAQTL